MFFAAFAALSLLATQASAQDADGYIFVRIPAAEQTSEDPLVQAKALLPNMAQGSELVIRDEETDVKGVRHIAVNQYIGETLQEEALLRLHIKEGKLIAISGQVTTEQSNSQAKARRANRMAMLSAEEAMHKAGVKGKADRAKLVDVQIKGELRTVYKKQSGMNVYYIDAYTGELLREESAIRNASDEGAGTDVTGKAETFYLGTQDMTSVQLEDGKHVLHDNGRKIYTYNASMAVLTEQDFYNYDEDDVEEFYTYCQDFTNDSKDWLGIPYTVGIAGYTYSCDNTKWKDVYVKIYQPTLAEEKPLFVPLTMLHEDDMDDDDWDDGFLDEDNDDEDGNDEEDDDDGYTSIEDLYINFDEPIALAPQKQYYAAIMYNLKGDTIVDGVYNLRLSADYVEIQTGHLDDILTQRNTVIGFQPALDAHVGMQRIYDFYKQELNRDSYDNRGSVIRSYFNIPDRLIGRGMVQNACAVNLENGEGIMCYGAGYPKQNPYVLLEIAGHEFTHLVAKDLLYRNESGALNEGFADIMGTTIKTNVTGVECWGIGMGLEYKDAEMEFRNFGDPHKCEQPCYYLQDEYYYTLPEDEEPNGGNDYGGVHTNSGVINHWFYLLCKGNDAVTPIPQMEAMKIAYYTLVGYQFPNMTYPHARKASVLEAAILYGEDSQQLKSVKAAWDAVGVFADVDEDHPTSVAFPSAANRQNTGSSYSVQGVQVNDDYRGIVVSEGAKTLQ